MKRKHFFEKGQRFGRWTLTGETEHRGDRTFQVCRCDCGTQRAVAEGSLADGKSKSCGCLSVEISSQRVLNPRKHFFRAGDRLGRLVLIGETVRKGGRTHQVCLCDCGAVKVVVECSLISGTCRSCGCLRRETTAASRRTHGQSHKSAEYYVWKGMHGRCTNPRQECWHNYGGRGIKVCPRWKDFALFLADMGPRPSDQHSIDRVDNDGDYTPDNCRWATRTEQSNNTRFNNTILHEGRLMTAAQWEREKGFSQGLIALRAETGWNLEDALNTPMRQTRTYAFKGEEHTLAEWAATLGTTSSVLTNRLFNGWSVERTLSEPLHKARTYAHNGEEHTLAEWAALTGLTRAALANRLKSGWSVQDALTKPLRVDH